MTIESFAELFTNPHTNERRTREWIYKLQRKDFIKPELIQAFSEALKAAPQDFADITPEDDVTENVPRETLDVTENKGNIIYVPLFAYGGFLGGYRSIIFIDQLEHFRLPGVMGEHYAFEIGGFSMYKPGDERSATPGDIAISKKLEDLKHMMKGKGYILQTIDGILYKIFDKFVGEKAHFHSLNEEYDGIVIPLKELKLSYFVTFILKKQTNS